MTMKNILATTTATCVAFAFLASPALADHHGKTATHGKLLKVSEVMGAKLFNQKGEHIGEINDIVFDENTGGMPFATLAIGGWLGLGEKLSTVPWKMVHQSEKETPGFVLEVDKAKLSDNSTNFDKNNWPKADSDWYAKNATYFGVTVTPNVKLVQASMADDAKLFNQKGEHIGQIKDLVMEAKSGKITHAVIDVGQYVGKVDQYTQVPWELVRQSKKDTPGFVLNVDKAKLQSATYFTPDSWPTFNDPKWHNDIYSYYGLPAPDWKSAGLN